MAITPHSVSAGDDWALKFTVPNGQRVTMSANGGWKYDFYHGSGPGGNGVISPDMPVPNAPQACLLFRRLIVWGPPLLPQPGWHVAEVGYWPADSALIGDMNSGAYEFRINDDDLSDNSGSITVYADITSASDLRNIAPMKSVPRPKPIRIRAVDANGALLFEQAVPFEIGINAKQLLERAFVLAQTPAKPDPFLYTLEYYGYSQSEQYPGYLGYEIESIANLPTNSGFYWDLLVDGTASLNGAETTYPEPGGTVLWRYTNLPANPKTFRASSVRSRKVPHA